MTEIKDPEMYKDLRKGGASKKRATRIVKTAAGGSRPSRSGRYDDWTVFELKCRAKDLGLPAYSQKSKSQLIGMLTSHRTT